MMRSLVIMVLLLLAPLAVVPVFLRPPDEPEPFVVTRFSGSRPGVVERTLATMASNLGWEPHWVKEIQRREFYYRIPPCVVWPEEES